MKCRAGHTNSYTFAVVSTCWSFLLSLPAALLWLHNDKVYRLLVAKTYEMHMFKTASKKLGLDQAVLSGSRPQNKQDKQAPTKAEV